MWANVPCADCKQEHKISLIFFLCCCFQMTSSSLFSSSFKFYLNLLSSIIHVFVQSTRLESKTSTPAWPLLSQSTAALTPSRVGSPIRSEGKRQENGRCFSRLSERFFFLSSKLFLLYLLGVVGFVLHGLISVVFSCFTKNYFCHCLVSETISPNFFIMRVCSELQFPFLIFKKVKEG